jgi:hypothetical protein
MVNKAVTKDVSKGICSFCKGEFEKAKMTQHLRYCKQRAAEIGAEAASATETQKTKLFHLLVEGSYNPGYWMHLEMPASDALEDLDYFLRDIWLECCGHLSEFTIGGTSYSSEPEDYFFSGEAETDEVEEEDEEELNVDELLESFPSEYLNMLPQHILTDLKKLQSVDDMTTYLRDTSKSIPTGGHPRTPDESNAYRSHYFQQQILDTLLEMVEDRSLDVPLEKVLKVGQKFSYEYDFGSTTDLTLKVVSEREGYVHEVDEDNIEVIARNIQPVMTCKVCGKPATLVVSGYFNVEENAVCSKKCARKSGEDVEMLLPVVNSPRVGVCAYTGED